jgi:serine/threonine protein phosphatase 1
MTIYAIGDIHGHLDKLRTAHDLVETDRAREGSPDAPLVHVGDLVDRGPDSAGVVARLMELSLTDGRVVVLKGNHDSMFVEFLTNRPGRWTDSRYLHPNIGGRATLASYGVPENGSARALHDKPHKRLCRRIIARFLRACPSSTAPGTASSFTQVSNPVCRWKIRTPQT